MENHDCRSNFRLVIVQPCRGLSTGAVFKAWHEAAAPERPDTDAALRALKTGDLNLLCASIRNVLQPVSEALRPEIGEAIRLLKDRGAVTALMTGSGSAVFGVFRSAAAAAPAAETLSRQWRSVFLCHTQTDSVRISAE